MAPKPPPRAPKISPSLDFHRFWVDFGRFVDDFLYHVGYFLSGLSHYFLGYLELSFSNFWPQVQMCWGRPQGSVRSQKSAMWPTFCLACLFVSVASSPTFQVPQIFLGRRMLLANCGRRQGGGNAEGKWIITDSHMASYGACEAARSTDPSNAQIEAERFRKRFQIKDKTVLERGEALSSCYFEC